MGYNSSWAFVVHSEDEKALVAFEEWLKEKGKDLIDYANSKPEYVEDLVAARKNGLYKFFAEQKDDRLSFPNKEGYITYTHPYTKCYDTWDSMMLSIRAYFEEHKLEWEYVRLGEDRSDYEQYGSENADFISVVTSLDFTF